MHSMNLPAGEGRTIRAHFNGDFSGSVILVLDEKDVTTNERAGTQVSVPFEAIEALVAERDQRVREADEEGARYELAHHERNRMLDSWSIGGREPYRGIFHMAAIGDVLSHHLPLVDAEEPHRCLCGANTQTAADQAAHRNDDSNACRRFARAAAPERDADHWDL